MSVKPPSRRVPRRVLTTPVLVLGGGVTGLGVVRTFGRMRIPAYLLCAPGDFAARSRWARRVPGLPPEGGGASENLPAILDRVELEKAVLIPCSDSAARGAAALPPHLEERFAASVPALETLEILTDKAGLFHLLERERIAHPRTHVLEGEDDVERLDEDLFQDAFLKPTDSQRFFGRFGRKAFRVSGRHDAMARLREARAEGLEMLLQEYVPGPATAHIFLDGFRDRHGRVTSLFARRRLRMHPPDFGNSSLTVSIDAGEVTPAIKGLERLLTAVEYRGIFSAEFKQDVRDGAFRLVEVNCRAWWYVEFAERCGARICEAAYRDALHLPMEGTTNVRTGVHCAYPEYDLAAWRALKRSERPSLWTWFRPWLGGQQALFVWDDPGPWLHAVAGRVRRRLARGPTGGRSDRGR